MFGWLKKKPVEYPSNSEWVVMEGDNRGKPMFIRCNISARVLAGNAEFGYRVGVAIPLLQPNQLGFPDDPEMEDLNSIEDLLIQRLCESKNSLQVLAITTSGMREFIFYTRAPKEWPPVFKELDGGKHQIQAYIAEDPKWSVYLHFAPKVTPN